MGVSGIILSDHDFCTTKLKEMLEDGEWHSCEEIREQMAANGIPLRVFKQSRKTLGVKTKNDHGRFYWRLE